MQVIEKYQALAHDSSLSGDRVATENFQQHAEHYIRLINDAQKQIVERREQMEAQNSANGQGSNNNNNNNNNGNRAPQQSQQPARDLSEVSQPSMNEPVRAQNDKDQSSVDLKPSPLGDVGEVGEGETNGGLVETPESNSDASAPKPKRARKPRAPKKVADASDASDGAQPAE